MLGEKNQRKNHGLSSEGRNEICTCCHSLITPDLPGSFNLNQTGLLPTLADSGFFLTYQHKVKTMCKHTSVCMGVCACLLQAHCGGDLEKSETSCCGVQAWARQQIYWQTTSVQKSQIPDCQIFAIWGLCFQVYFDQIPRINLFHKRKAIASDECSWLERQKVSQQQQKKERLLKHKSIIPFTLSWALFSHAF